jgi:hypothetical protein
LSIEVVKEGEKGEEKKRKERSEEPMLSGGRSSKRFMSWERNSEGVVKDRYVSRKVVL